MAVLTARQLLKLVTCIALCSVVSRGFAADRLIGLGLHQETGRDIYLGGLYLDENTPRPGDLRNLAAPRVMEYRVVARRTSIRSLLGSILLQSEIATGKQPSSSTAEFADLLLSKVKSSLYAGDSLRIALTDNNDTQATLNGVKVASVPDPEVSNYLLTGWLSENGPSTQFRSTLLAPSINPQLLTKLDSLTASAERTAEVATWVNTLPAPIPATEPAANQTLAQQAPEGTPASLVDDVFQPQNRTPDELTEPVSEPASEPIAAGTAAADDTRQEIQALETASTALPALNLEPAIDNLGTLEGQPSLDTLGAAPLPTTSLALNSQDLGSLALDTEILSLGVQEYSRRLSAFHNNLVARVYRAIKYPKRAIRRSLEGRLELDITLRNSGELVSVSVAETSGHRLLDEAAVEAAETAMSAADLKSLDVVAVAEFGNQDGRVVVPVPVNFQLMK